MSDKPTPTPLDPEKVLAQAAAGLQHDREPVGAPAPSVEELTPSFPDYRIRALIGRGGMGAVYRALHLRLDREVALKILPKELAKDPTFEERFTREARALALLDHPHILKVYDFGEAGGWFYLVTEYVDGADLRQMMQLDKLSPEEAVRLVPQICQALHYAHGRGVVHRDVKPENILVDQDGNVKVADFGIAKLTGDLGDGGFHLTGTRQILGTPHYMAPEQVERPTQVDHRADIFSLGVVFYEMLTGQLPLGRFAPPSKRTESPPQLDPVVMRSLEPEPKRRYQSVEEMRSDIVHGGPRTAIAQPSKLEVLRARRNQRWAKHDDRPLVASFLLAIGVFGVAGSLITGAVEWSWLAMLALAAAAAMGFSALSTGFRDDPRGLRLAGAVCSAWLPLLLLGNLLLGVLLAIVIDAADVAASESSGVWILGVMLAIDIVILVRLYRRTRRSNRWRR